eukprot:498323_1
MSLNQPDRLRPKLAQRSRGSSTRRRCTSGSTMSTTDGPSYRIDEASAPGSGSPGSMSPSHSVSHEIVAVVVTEHEQYIFNDIKAKYTQVNNQLLVIEENIRLLEMVAQQNKKKINRLRSEMINKVHATFNALEHTSDGEVARKLKELNLDKTKLKRYHEQLFHAKTKYNLLLIDGTVTPMQRKEKILHLRDDLPQDVKYQNTIIPKVKVSLNREVALRVMDTVGHIRNYATPQPPVLTVKTLTDRTLTVQADERSESMTVTLEIAEEEEEEDAELEWMEMEYSKVSETECQMKNLMENTRYSLRARYRNRYGFSKYSDVQRFKTKKVGLLIDSSSCILDDYGAEKQILCGLLNGQKEKFVFRKLKCIYSSMSDGFNVNACHSACQNECNILFVIHSNDGNIFGAFTKTKWKTDNNIDQKDADSFVFVLKSSAEEYSAKCFDVICSQSMAVWYHSNYFCLFGTGYDISIYKTCHRSEQYTYVSKGNYEMPSKYSLNADSKRFTVKNIEIFRCAK